MEVVHELIGIGADILFKDSGLFLLGVILLTIADGIVATLTEPKIEDD